MWPGTPTTVELSGTSRSTTEPAPTREFSPMVMLPSTRAPAPMTTLLPMVGWRLPVSFAGAAQGDALVERDVVADDRGLADDDAHAVIDEEAAADLRAGMNLDAGDQAGDLRQDAGHKAPAMRSTASD